MTKKAKFVISIFFLFIIVFIAAILIGEYQNMNILKSEGHIIPMTDAIIGYRKANLNIWAVNLLLTFAIPTIFLCSGLSGRLMDIVSRRFKYRFFRIGAFAIVYLLFEFVIKLPLRYYSSFIIVHRYEISNQTVFRWLSNVAKNFVIDIVIWGLFLWFPYYLIRKYRAKWWLYLGLLAFPVLIFTTYITPTLIDPLFNEYIPIQDPSLDMRIQEQLHRAGIEDCNVYQVNKSIDTKNMNAYMTGTFKSKRIVLWDTTIENLTEDETISILSHEIGHYIEGHIWKSIFLGSLLIILALFLTNKICLWFIDNAPTAFRFRRLHQIASLPLILLVINGLMFFSSPIVNAHSRHYERQADAVEMELTQDADSFVSVLTKLYRQSLSMPRVSKLYRLWYNSHPTYEERVRFAREEY